MNDLTNEITSHFLSSKMGARIVESIDNKYLTITLKQQEYYGVGILNIYDKQVNESFANVKLETKLLELNGKVISFLVLSSSKYEFRSSFARVCVDFVELGENNTKREEISSNPFSWWERWRELLGNVSVEKKPYSVIGEMWIYLQEIKNHNSLEWTGPSRKNHDLEGDKYHLEVKSSISQFENVVTISNQFQLDSKVPLYLVFLKMQESKDGINIDELVEKLVEQGIDRAAIEQNLGKMNMPLGSSMRQKRYLILEGRKYLVDENFPTVKAESFVGGQFPKNVKKIIYEVDLTPYDYETIDISEQ